jgi:hypothetical protein
MLLDKAMRLQVRRHIGNTTLINVGRRVRAVANDQSVLSFMIKLSAGACPFQQLVPKMLQERPKSHAGRAWQ